MATRSTKPPTSTAAKAQKLAQAQQQQQAQQQGLLESFEVIRLANQKLVLRTAQLEGDLALAHAQVELLQQALRNAKAESAPQQTTPTAAE